MDSYEDGGSGRRGRIRYVSCGEEGTKKVKIEGGVGCKAQEKCFMEGMGTCNALSWLITKYRWHYYKSRKRWGGAVEAIQMPCLASAVSGMYGMGPHVQ